MLRLTAEKTKHLYPRASEIVMKDLYVDHCLSGESTREDVQYTTHQLQLVLEKGGFTRDLQFQVVDLPKI